MMNKSNRKFLVPLAALASVFPTGQASANIATEVASTDATITSTSTQVTPERLVLGTQDQMSFVLKRSVEGNLMAWHESHASHASHSSHRSHTSGY